MKNFLLLCACLWALALPFRSVAAGPPDIVVVRLLDSGLLVRGIMIRGEGKVEKIEFEGGSVDKKLFMAAEGYYKLIKGLYEEGYTLQNTFSNSAGLYITLVFVKAQ